MGNEEDAKGTIFENVKPKRIWSDFSTAKDGVDNMSRGAVQFIKALGVLAKGLVLLLGFTFAIAFSGLKTVLKRKGNEKNNTEVKQWKRRKSLSRA